MKSRKETQHRTRNEANMGTLQKRRGRSSNLYAKKGKRSSTGGGTTLEKTRGGRKKDPDKGRVVRPQDHHVARRSHLRVRGALEKDCRKTCASTVTANVLHSTITKQVETVGPAKKLAGKKKKLQQLKKVERAQTRRATTGRTTIPPCPRSTDSSIGKTRSHAGENNEKKGNA